MATFSSALAWGQKDTPIGPGRVSASPARTGVFYPTHVLNHPVQPQARDKSGLPFLRAMVYASGQFPPTSYVLESQSANVVFGVHERLGRTPLQRGNVVAVGSCGVFVL